MASSWQASMTLPCLLDLHQQRQPVTTAQSNTELGTLEKESTHERNSIVLIRNDFALFLLSFRVDSNQHTNNAKRQHSITSLPRALRDSTIVSLRLGSLRPAPTTTKLAGKRVAGHHQSRRLPSIRIGSLSSSPSLDLILVLVVVVDVFIVDVGVAC
jgi:hypothetical protein